MMAKLILGIVLILAFGRLSHCQLGEIEKMYISLFPETIKGSPDEKLTLIDTFLADIVPVWFNQRPANENGTRYEFKEYAYLDDSNDDAAKLTGQEIITRSGYDYETYDAIADDGYITTLTRIVNPLADRKKLRQPPVLMEHGGTIDPTAYLIASSIQHHPEKYPRDYHIDGPITSWNRSLAFVLANNGFDVFLAETRGASDKNKRKDPFRSVNNVLRGVNDGKNMTSGENLVQIQNSLSFNSFSMDDIISHELRSHMDTVTRVTGIREMQLFTFSMSTPSSLAFLSIAPDYAKRLQGYVSMAPIISGAGVNKLLEIALQKVCPLFPERAGSHWMGDILLTQPFRDLLVWFSQSKLIRYSIVKSVVNIMFGASAKYETLLELNVIGHLLRRLSFRHAKQLCQQTESNKLQKYDYGPIKNKLIYGTKEPPVYDLSDLQIGDWIIVSGANDAIATQEIVEDIYRLANPKPMAQIIAPGFNHVDLIAGFDNDKYVNLPILAYFLEMSDRYMTPVGARFLNMRTFDMNQFLPPEMRIKSNNKTESNFGTQVSRSVGSLTGQFDPSKIVGDMSKGFNDMIKGLGSMIQDGGKRNEEKATYTKNREV